MTISTTDSVTPIFAGNDVATSFPFTNFKVNANADLEVYYVDAAGVETLQTETVDYTLLLNADQDASPGGTITYPVAGDPLATGDKLFGLRAVAQLQSMDLTNQSKYDAEVVELNSDIIVQQIQQIQEAVDRSVKVTIASEDDPDALIASINLSESNAAASAGAASTAQGLAETAQTAAELAETNAETAQTAAELAETNAETAQTAAELAETNAETAQTAAELALDTFDDRFLGAKASDPTLDNDSNALLDGALYWNTTVNEMRVYDLGGTAWRQLRENLTVTSASPTTAYAADLDVSRVFNLTLGGDTAVTFSNVPATGEIATIVLKLTQDGTGTRTPSFPAAVIWEGGAEPAWSTGGGTTDIVTLFTIDGGTTWYGNLVGQGYA